MNQRRSRPLFGNLSADLSSRVAVPRVAAALHAARHSRPVPRLQAVRRACRCFLHRAAHIGLHLQSAHEPESSTCEKVPSWLSLVEIARITISPGLRAGCRHPTRRIDWSPSFHFSRARANSWNRRLRVRQSLSFRSKRSGFEFVSRRSFPTSACSPLRELPFRIAR